MRQRPAHLRASDPSIAVTWDAAGGVGLRLDKDEW
jgi:hypothetical protein